MKLLHLHLEDFATYKKLSYSAQEGLTLVTGDNGAGKSTIIEGLVFALYGETVRGSSPGDNCIAEVIIEGKAGFKARVHRAKKDGKTKLSLAVDDKILTGATTTETQGKINAAFGPMDRFVATTVFSREFMARFGTATDKERKALIESILGLGQFDMALATARLSLKDVSIDHAQFQGREAALIEAGTRLKMQVANLVIPLRTNTEVKAELAQIEEDEAARRAVYKKLSDAVAGANRLIQGATSVRAKLSGEREGYLRTLQTLRGKITNTMGLTACPVCLRDVDGLCKDNIKAHYDEQIAEASKAAEAIEVSLSVANDEVDELTVERSALERRVRDSNSASTSAAAYANSKLLAAELAQIDAYDSQKTRLEKEIQDVDSDILAVAHDAEACRVKIATLNAVVEVLGTRGARAMIFARSLARIEQEANRVLSKLGLGLQVGICGTTELKTGREVSAISVTVKGAGDGDYRALSSGEKARVDVGLLLGLESLLGGGLVAFDEVFDSLDAAGQEAVARYLDELGRVRQVIVITHHDELKSLFSGGARLRAVKDADGSRLDSA